MEVKTSGGHYEAATGLALLVVIACICLVIGFAGRYEDVNSNKEYQYVQAQVKEVIPYEFRDDDGDYCTHYSAILEFVYLRDKAEIHTNNIFNTRPEIGATIPLLVKKTGDTEYDYCRVKKDWLTGEYVDREKDYDAPIFIAGLLLSFAMIPLGVLVKSQFMKKLCFVGMVILLLASGVFYAMAGGFIGLIFCLVLLFIVWLFWAPIRMIKKGL